MEPPPAGLPLPGQLSGRVVPTPPLAASPESGGLGDTEVVPAAGIFRARCRRPCRLVFHTPFRPRQPALASHGEGAQCTWMTTSERHGVWSDQVPDSIRSASLDHSPLLSERNKQTRNQAAVKRSLWSYLSKRSTGQSRSPLVLVVRDSRASCPWSLRPGTHGRLRRLEPHSERRGRLCMWVSKQSREGTPNDRNISACGPPPRIVKVE